VKNILKNNRNHTFKQTYTFPIQNQSWLEFALGAALLEFHKILIFFNMFDRFNMLTSKIIFLKLKKYYFIILKNYQNNTSLYGFSFLFI